MNLALSSLTEQPYQYIPDQCHETVHNLCEISPENLQNKIHSILLLSERKTKLEQLKTCLQHIKDDLKQVQSKHPEGLALAYHYSNLYDQIIHTILQNLSKKDTPTIIAIGGYGRGELYPRSDLDLIWLVEDDKRQASHQQAFEGLLYLLWDLGCKVGHSVHSPKSAADMAQNDMVFATALMDARKLCGQDSLYEKFRQAHQVLRSRPSFVRAFVASKLDECQARHKQYPDSAFQLQPNLKDGIGTLRDLQTIRWIIRALNVSSETFFCERSLVIFKRCYRQLSTLRMALHISPQSKNGEQLLFDAQQEIAENLKYRQHQHLKPIMRLMKQFFATRYQVELLEECFLARLGDVAILQKGRGERSFLEAKTFAHLDRPPNTFAELLDYFLKLVETNRFASAEGIETLQKKRFLASISSTKSEALPKIRAILTAPEGKGMYAFRLMGKLGILGRAIPEYTHIMGLGQWDGNHAYSVDNHTIQVIENLHRSSLGHEESTQAFLDALLIRSGTPDTLFIAAFLHDIGKGLGGKHADKGATIAQKLAPVLGFNQTETKTIVWLVRHHLLLSALSLQRDILDPNTVQILAEQTADQHHLDLLYCLTVADIRGVSRKSWTEWKASLLSRLYDMAVIELSSASDPNDRMQQKRDAAQALYDAFPEDDHQNIQTHLRNCTGDYLLSTELNLQVLHAKMLINRKSLNVRESIIRTFPKPDSAIVQLVIFTKYYGGLIGHTLAVLSKLNYSIATMKIYPYGNTDALCTFWFNQKGKVINEQRQLDRLCHNLQNTIEKRYFDTDTLPERDDPEVFTGVDTRITINNNASRRATVIEVQTRNRSRLLFDLSRAFNKSKVRIHAAKIDTVGQRAIDVFYVLNRFGLKVVDEEHLQQIRKNLIDHINNKN